MYFISKKVNPLGLGCWPSAGPMYAPDGRILGYANADKAAASNTLHAAIDHGITVFDTAPAYGAGYSERLLGETLGNKPDCQIVTKIGIGIDEDTKKLAFDKYPAAQVSADIDSSRKRLKRDCIDLVVLHLNALAVADAEPILDALQESRQQGKIEAYGWSTDFADSVSAVASNEGFIAVEHAMNVLLDAPRMQQVTTDNELLSLIRSPLAMGLLSGKYDETSCMASDDIRSSDEGWLQYFANGRPNPVFLDRFHAIRELLQIDGRSTIQGALGWLWRKRETNFPIPGARTPEQVEQLAGALAYGPLPETVMLEIESLINRTHAVDEQDREK